LRHAKPIADAFTSTSWGTCALNPYCSPVRKASTSLSPSIICSNCVFMLSPVGLYASSKIVCHWTPMIYSSLPLGPKIRFFADESGRVAASFSQRSRITSDL
jgi:hypothetical protein